MLFKMECFGTEEYYKKMLDLQDKLRKSEEERLKLEEKFNEILLINRDVEHDRIRLIRHRYHKFLEEDTIRQTRNAAILQSLDRIETRAKIFAAKTNRFKAFRKQYECYIKHIPQTTTTQSLLNQPEINSKHPNVRRKLFETPDQNTNVETKLAMLEQFLVDNFDNFPGSLHRKTKEDVLNENQQQNLFIQDSEDSQELNEIESMQTLKRREILGNKIEEQLEQLKNREQTEQILQNYKDVISKSEEKFGLKENLNKKNIQEASLDVFNQNKIASKINDGLTDDKTVDDLKNSTLIENNNTIIEKESLESENSVIDNHNAFDKLENNIDDIKLIEPDYVQENSKFSEQQENSERTEPPTDVSLNQLTEYSQENAVEYLQNEESVQQCTEEQIISEENIEEQSKQILDAINYDDYPQMSNENNTVEEKIVEDQNYENQNYSTNEEHEDKSNENIVDNLENYPVDNKTNEDVIPQQYDQNYEYQNYSTNEDQQQYEDQTNNYQENVINNPEENITNKNIIHQQYEQNDGNQNISQEAIENQPIFEEYPQQYTNEELELTNEYQHQENYDPSQTSQQIISEFGYEDNANYSQENFDTQEYQPTEQYVENPEEYEQYQGEQYLEPQENYPVEQVEYSNYPNQEYQQQEYSENQEYLPTEQQENLYHSEQEYLEGEQNIDRQYESEQNLELQQNLYTEGYVEESNINQSEQPTIQQEMLLEDNEGDNNVNTEYSVSQNDFVNNEPLIEKQLPNLAEMLDTDTESTKRETEVSNDDDFNFSK